MFNVLSVLLVYTHIIILPACCKSKHTDNHSGYQQQDINCRRYSKNPSLITMPNNSAKPKLKRVPIKIYLVFPVLLSYTSGPVWLLL
jgi:hypothetical protein